MSNYPGFTDDNEADANARAKLIDQHVTAGKDVAIGSVAPSTSDAGSPKSSGKKDYVDEVMGEPAPNFGSPDGEEPYDMRKSRWRFLMLFLSCTFLVGNYFCYDNPSVIADQMENALGIDGPQWSLFFTVYSIPNFVLPLFGGIFLDKIGMRLGLVLFTVVVTIGQCIFMFGGYALNYPLMLVGRVVFGLGGESMTVAQSTIISLWFKGKELNFAMGLNLSVSRLGSVVNSFIVPRVEESSGLGNALMVGAVICGISTIAAFALAALDKKAEEMDPNGQKAKLSDDDKFQFRDLMHFKLPFWLLTISCVVTYASVFPYLQNCGTLLQYKYHFTAVESAQLQFTPYIISAVLCPFLGFGIDKVGRRVLFIILSSLILMGAFFSSMLMPDCPDDQKCYYEVLPLVLTGMGYSLYASVIWGSIPYTVEPKTVGTAFGIATAIQQIGQAYAPWQVAKIIAMKPGGPSGNGTNYEGADWFYIAVNGIGLISNIILYFVDIKYQDGILNKVDSTDTIEALITSPQPGTKGDIIRQSMSKGRNAQALAQYKTDDDVRQSLKRSLAAQRPFQ